MLTNKEIIALINSVRVGEMMTFQTLSEIASNKIRYAAAMSRKQTGSTIKVHIDYEITYLYKTK